MSKAGLLCVILVEFLHSSIVRLIRINLADPEITTIRSEHLEGPGRWPKWG